MLFFEEMSPYSSDGVDLTLIEWMLSLTPAERLDVLEGTIAFVTEVRRLNGIEPVPADSPKAV